MMGVVNVTPDSFSDGGRWFDTADAIEHARLLVAQGADLIDIGGESTRPGAQRPSIAEELRRVLPVIEALAGLVPISVDTMRAEVARAVVACGAEIINDVSGGLSDSAMHDTVAELQVQYICQHWRGHGEVMDSHASYQDVVAEVRAELMNQMTRAIAAGIAPERIIIDPGFGFAKDAAHNWTLLAHLDEFLGLGHRVLIGVSRKRFLAQVSRGSAPQDRDAATAALTLHCAKAGAWAVRTHEVSANVVAVNVAERLAEEN